MVCVRNSDVRSGRISLMMLVMLMATTWDDMVMISQGRWSHSKTVSKQARGVGNCEVYMISNDRFFQYQSKRRGTSRSTMD